MNCSLLRRITYPLALLALGFLLLPLPALLIYVLFPFYWELSGAAAFVHDAPQAHLFVVGGNVALISLAFFVVAVILGLLVIGGVPRLFNLLLRKDRTYVLTASTTSPAGDRGDDELRVLQPPVRRQLRRRPLGALARL